MTESHFTYDLTKIIEDVYTSLQHKYPNFIKEDFIRYYEFMEFDKGNVENLIIQPYYRDMWKEVEGIVAVRASLFYQQV